MGSKRKWWFLIPTIVAFFLMADFALNKKSLRGLVDPYLPLISSVVPFENYYLSRPNYLSKERLYQQVLQGNNQHIEFLWLGDSHIQNYDVARYFEGAYSANLGIANDTLVGLINRVNRLPDIKPPNRLILLVGYNDLRYRQVDEIILLYKELIRLLQKKFSLNSSRLVLLSLLPVGEERGYTNQAIRQLNTFLAHYSEMIGMQFINVHNAFSVVDVANKQKIFKPDLVHLSEEGYQRMTQLLLPELEKL